LIVDQMKLTCYETHIHTPMCGHARGSLGDYAEVARRRNLKGIYVTDHCPMPESYEHQGRIARDRLSEYVEMVVQAGRDWAGRVDVVLGIESDWLPGMEPWLERLHRQADFQYVLGSIHCHLPDYRRLYLTDNALAFQMQYFTHLAQAAETGLFDALAHPDLVKDIHPDQWQVSRLLTHLKTCLDRIASTGVAMELNTGAEKKALAEWRPGVEILKLMNERGIPVVIGSDAHEPEQVAKHLPSALNMLKEIGFATTSYYRGRRRLDVPIADAIASLKQQAVASESMPLRSGPHPEQDRSG